MSARHCRAWMRMVAALLYTCSMPLFAAAIIEMTPGPIRVTKGDLVVLEAQPSEGAKSIEWWSEGRIICQKIRCDIDTSSFTPGAYHYEVVVSDDDGVAVGTVAISADDAKPLHVPQVITPMALPPKSGYSKISIGEWVIVPRAGLVLATSDGVGGKPNTLTSPSQMFDGVSYKIGSGSQAIIRQIGSSRQWLLSAPASFRLRGGVFQLTSGKALFRETESMTSSDEVGEVSMAYLANVEVRATGSALMGVEMQPVKDRRVKLIVRNFAGGDLSIVCGPGDVASVSHAQARHVELAAEGSCVGEADLIEQSGDPGIWFGSWMPWWTNLGVPLGADRWRVERHLWQQMLPETQLQEKRSEALKSHTCPDILDLLTGSGVNASDGDAMDQTIGDCLFDLGMIRAALQKFKHMEANGQVPDWTAFMLGRCYQALAQPVLALSWYELAERRGLADRGMLGRFAADAALKAGLSKDRLRWLETAAMQGDDQAHAQGDWDSVRDWRASRPRGGSIGGRFYMDGQALPINSKKTKEMPGSAVSSRSTVYALDGLWWSNTPVTVDSIFKLAGQHNFIRPYVPSLAIGQKSMHEITTSFAAGQSRDSGWTAEAGLRVGTGISGFERQRDHLGWYAVISRPDWFGFYFGIDSSKYLDPKPGGADVLDLDLNRFTGEADHSHIDLVGLLGWGKQISTLSVAMSLTYGHIDYRTGIMDQFDHFLAKLEMQAAWSLSHKANVVVKPRYLSRRFKDEGGTESDAIIDSGIYFRTAPLWTAWLNAAYESRNMSADESVSYVRHSYGIGLSVDL